MRILMVSNLWPPEVVGGAEQYAAALVGAVAGRAGHEVDVVTLGVEGPDVVRTVAARGRIRSRHRAHAVRGEAAALPRGRPLQPARARAASTRCSTSCARRRAHARGPGALEHRAHPARPPRRRARAHAPRLLAAVPAQLDGAPRRAAVRDAVPVVRRRSRGSANEAMRRSPPGVVLAVSQAIAREHERLPGSCPGCGSSTTRWRSSPAPARCRGATGRPLTFGFLGRLGDRQGRRARCSTRSPRRPGRDAGSWSRAAVRSRPRCTPPDRRSSPRAG